MRAPLLIAAALTVLIAGAHSYLGERYILIRLFRRDNLPKLRGGVEFTKQTLRFAWHITSIAWVGLACLMIVLASSSAGTEHAVATVIAFVFAVTGVAAMVGSRGRHLSWVVFLAIAALVWFGSR